MTTIISGMNVTYTSTTINMDEYLKKEIYFMFLEHKDLPCIVITQLIKEKNSPYVWGSICKYCKFKNYSICPGIASKEGLLQRTQEAEKWINENVPKTEIFDRFI